MGYHALLFCPEEKTARVVTQVLNELEFTVEPCSETFAAVKKLMAQHFDALVVDCDNEQNATLLFKGARNSGSNQNSLMVAIVEGQTGVAKAFRIGANLVLTKPINVEQSKGTLRVARGLLRKGEAAKPAEQAPGGHAAAVAPFNPALAASTAQTGIPAPVASTSAFELDVEPAPQPDASESALLEYMPDSMPSGNAPAIQAEDPQFEDISGMTKQYPWQPVSKPLGEPMASALRRAAEAAGQSDPIFASASGAQASPSSAGAAAAPAPAKQAPRAQVTPIASSMAAAAAALTKKQEVAELVIEEPGGAVAEAPMFSGLSETAAQEASSTGSGSRKFLLVAIVVLAIAAGYLGWSRLQNGQPASPKSGTPVPSPSSTPATLSQAETPAAPSAEVTPQSAAAEAGEPEIIISRTPIQQPGQVPTDANTKASSSKPSAGLSTASASKEPPAAKAEEPIVVKTNPPPAPKASPAVEETAEAPAPGTLGGDSGVDPQALSRIVDANPASMPKSAPQTVKISQGVSEGLVVKRVKPVYPPHAMQVRLQGSVQLQANIGKDGSIVGVRQTSGDLVLGRAAMDAVRQWKYKPYYLNGEPVEVQTQITVNFKLP
jgi:protein TonB